MKRKLLIVLIVAFLVLFLTGCYICCPTCPQEEWVPEITGERTYCQILDLDVLDLDGVERIDDMRGIAPCANYRWPAKEWYQFTSVFDAQKVIDKIWGTGGDIITKFLLQPGCSELPFGYIKYSDGSQDYITAVINYGDVVEFYKISGPSGTLVKMYPDCSITEIVLY